MLTEQLAGILKDEKNLLSSILKTAEKKQTALVSNNRDALDATIKEEEKYLPRLRELEILRIKAIQTIYLSTGKKTDDYTIGTLLAEFDENLSDDEKNNLASKQKAIRDLINTVTKLNDQNLYLINHSRRFINETINAIINSSERSILDKKV
ncbi:MAG: flagellar protein FlgN [Chlorobi bacterium]|nr:flagellar protein FlgN [Chlorobiota bacterium]